MKKGKFIGLGITALALGVVAGAIGAQKATEVEATPIGSALYLRGVGSWDAQDAYKFSATSEEGYDYELKNVSISASVEWKIADSTWGTYNYAYTNMTFVGNNNYFSAGGGGNVRTDEGGVYDFYIEVKSTSALQVKVVNQGAVDPVAITQWDIIGTFNEWAEDETQISMPLVGDYYTATVDFATGVEFKIRGNGGWTYSLGTQWVDKINDSKILTKAGSNAYVVYAGRFTFKISKDVTDVILAGASIGTYLDVTYVPKTFAIDTVYLTKPADWGSTLYAYAYNSEGHNADWPGTAMTKVSTNEFGQDVYSISGLTGYVNIIFSDGTKQTVDGDAASFGANNACWIGEIVETKYSFGGYYNYSTDRAALIEWAIAFDGAEDLCNGEGDEWSKFATSYTALDPAAKAYFAASAVTAAVDGDTLQRAAYRYEYGVAVKGQTAFAATERPTEGFVTEYSAGLTIFSNEKKNSLPMVIALTVSVGAIAAAAGFVFLRKKRNNA